MTNTMTGSGSQRIQTFLSSRITLAVAALLVVAGWNLSLDGSAVDRGMASPVAWTGLAVLAIAGHVVGEIGSRRGWPGLAAVEVGAVFLVILGLAAVCVVGPNVGRWTRIGIIGLAAAAALALGYVVGRRTRAEQGHESTLAFAVPALVVATWAVHDARLGLIVNHFYDLQVYLAAGHHALSHQPVYLLAPLAALPSSAAKDFFLYPPPLIPFFEVLAKLPFGLVSVLWLAGLVAAAFVAFRLLGLTWRWSLLLLAFPPLLKGFESGNVASVLFLAVAAGYRFGPGLVAGTLFKVQSVIPLAWLVREQRWRDLVTGGVLVAAICVVSLPLTGIVAWHDWLAGLGYRAQSQGALPILYGASIARALPSVVFGAVAVAAVAAIFLLRGRRGLAASGIATIVASPTLWPHGFVMAIPALLGAPAAAIVWAGFGFGTLDSLGPWIFTVLAGAMLLAPSWADVPVDSQLSHPLGGQTGPWSASVSARIDPAPPAMPVMA